MNLIQTAFECEAPVALVTGSGAPRVGRAIAVDLARAGCRIAIHANTSDDDAHKLAAELNERFKTESIVTLGAIEQDSVAEDLVDQTVQAFGRLDVLVNSAAIWKPTKLERVTAAEIRHYFDVNAIGTFLCARAAGEIMSTQASGGSIVNLGDWATVRPYMDHAAYFPSKGAIPTLTRNMAVELADRNPAIRVNCVAPGWIKTAWGEDADQRWQQRAVDESLWGRWGVPEDVARAAVFLDSPPAAFINGQLVEVNGGFRRT